MDGRSPTRGLGWLVLTTAAAASAIAGCSSFQGTTAASFLRTVREDGDPNLRYVAYDKLASPRCYDNEQQKDEVIAVLVAKLEQGREPVATRAVICRTLGELHDGKAREAVIKTVGDGEGVVRAQACRALGKVGLPEDATILARVMMVDTLEDCRIAAIEGIGDLKARDPRIAQVLLAGMDHDDPAIRLASLEALRRITGEDLGVDPTPWRKYLEAQVAAAAAVAPPERSAPTTATSPAPVPNRR